jgi:hypothetical protein
VSDWPLVVKELIDNALEACEETGVAPVISVTVNEAGIEVLDNGPALPADTTKGVLDYTVRVSSREGNVSQTRGAPANAPTNSREYPRKRSKLMKPPVSCYVAGSFRGRTRGMGRHRSAPRLLQKAG